MAGTLSPVTFKRPSRGVVKHKVAFTCDAAGVATATIVGLGVGRLVGVALPVGAYAFGQAVITVSDGDSGAPILALDTQGMVSATEDFDGTTTGEDDTELFSTSAPHGLSVGDQIVILSKTGGTLPTVGTTYFVRAAAAEDTFELSATLGGTAIDLGSDVSAMTWRNLSDGYPVFASTTTGEADTELFTSGAVHGLTVGDKIVIVSLTGGTGLTVGNAYYVKTVPTTATFTLSASLGGAVAAFSVDVSAMVWRNITDGTPTFAPRFIRPTAVVTTAAGVAVTAHATAPNVNRDIFVASSIKVAVAAGGPSATGSVHLIVDESQRPRLG